MTDTTLIAKDDFISSYTHEKMIDRGVSYKNINGLNVYHFFVDDMETVELEYGFDFDESTTDAVLIELDDETYEDVSVDIKGNEDLVGVKQSTSIHLNDLNETQLCGVTV